MNVVKLGAVMRWSGREYHKCSETNTFSVETPINLELEKSLIYTAYPSTLLQ